MLSFHSFNSLYAHLLLYHKNVPTMLRCLPRPAHSRGSRAFHLIHNLFSAHVNEHSATQLATVSRKIYPPADEVSLKVIDGKSDEILSMTLEQALKRLEPLSYLAEAEAGPGLYRIHTFPDPGPVEPVKQPSPRTSFKPYTRAGRGKEIHLTTSCTPIHFRNTLRISYKYILEGSRMEFHLHSKSERARRKDDPTVDWALANCMHLRPDSILAAMPPGTTMLAKPATTDLSFKKKSPRDLEARRSEVMWAMENTEALRRAKAVTPARVRKMGQWPEERLSSDNLWLHSAPIIP